MAPSGWDKAQCAAAPAPPSLGGDARALPVTPWVEGKRTTGHNGRRSKTGVVFFRHIHQATGRSTVAVAYQAGSHPRNNTLPQGPEGDPRGYFFKGPVRIGVIVSYLFAGGAQEGPLWPVAQSEVAPKITGHPFSLGQNRDCGGPWLLCTWLCTVCSNLDCSDPLQWPLVSRKLTL